MKTFSDEGKLRKFTASRPDLKVLKKNLQEEGKIMLEENLKSQE